MIFHYSPFSPQYYRARYGSEGVRAPLKGRTENYPTVGVSNKLILGSKIAGNIHEQ